MDNLNIHKHPLILDLIDDAGHRIVFRAPYWSCDGATEYVFITIRVKLQMNDNGVETTDDLINEIDDIIFHMVDHSFYPYFYMLAFHNNTNHMKYAFTRLFYTKIMSICSHITMYFFYM